MTGDLKRKEILKHTIQHFKRRPDLESIANTNLSSWEPKEVPKKTVICMDGDTLETARLLTKQYGKKCLVLNMASYKSFGGGYQNGRSAQEENIFRRTNAHFTRKSSGLYSKKESEAVQGLSGVFPTYPLVCIKKQEIGLEGDGYEMLEESEIFPFTEMRSAAIKASYCSKEQARVGMVQRIDAQFRTAKQSGHRFIVLGAFGCGAFRNDPEVVANIYLEALDKYKDVFDRSSF